MDNQSIDRAHRLVAEYISLEEMVQATDERNDGLRAEIEANERKAGDLTERQERIAEVLGPPIFKRGPVFFGTSTGRRYALSSDPDQSLLTVTELAPVFSLELAPRFSEAEIREAALYAAAESYIVTEDDGEIED